MRKKLLERHLLSSSHIEAAVRAKPQAPSALTGPECCHEYRNHGHLQGCAIDLEIGARTVRRALLRLTRSRVQSQLDAPRGGCSLDVLQSTERRVAFLTVSLQRRMEDVRSQ